MVPHATNRLFLSSYRGRAGAPATILAHGLPAEPGRIRPGATEEPVAEAAQSGAGASGGSGSSGGTAVAAQLWCLHTATERSQLGLGSGCQAQYIAGVTLRLTGTLKTEQQSIRKVLHAGITQRT